MQMTNEQLIFDLIPYIRQLSIEYSNDNISAEDLFSEGQLYVCEFVKKHKIRQYVTKYYLKTKLQDRFEQLSSKSNTDVLSLDNEMTITDSTEIDSDKILNIINESIKKNRDKEIFIDVYGFYTNHKTLEEVGNKYGLSQERVRQIVHKSEMLIKRYCIRNNIILEDLLR